MNNIETVFPAALNFSCTLLSINSRRKLITEKMHPPTINGLLRPNLDLQLSDQTPMSGISVTPAKGPDSQHKNCDVDDIFIDAMIGSLNENKTLNAISNPRVDMHMHIILNIV